MFGVDVFLWPDFPEPVVRSAACGDDAPVLFVCLPVSFRSHACCFFISRRREWRLQPAASSMIGHRARGKTSAPPPRQLCLVMLHFPVSVFPIFLARALRTSSSWRKVLSSWRMSAPSTMMCVWFRTLFTRIPAGVCWCYMPAPRREHGARGGDSGRSRLLTRPLLGCLCV